MVCCLERHICRDAEKPIVCLGVIVKNDSEKQLLQLYIICLGLTGIILSLELTLSITSNR